MTTRVIECRVHPLSVEKLRDRELAGRVRKNGTDVRAAGLVALLTVPVAGAAEAPIGWIAAGLSAMLLLCSAPLLGRLERWDWLTLICAVIGFAAPRGQVPAIGPALFVATTMCGALWLTNRTRRRTVDGHPQPGPRQRAAQVAVGQSGERYAGHVLARDLPEDYALLNGLELAHGAGDIDHLVVGPTGVFLMETKTMAGRIVCEPDGSWRRMRIGRGGTVYGAYIGDPATQVQRNIFAVRECLRRRLPRASHVASLWIEGMVVFPHPKTQLQTEHSRVLAVPLQEAAPRICTYVPARRLAPPEVESIVAALLEEARVQQVPAARRSAQALIEVALLMPLVLALAFGSVAISRLVQAQTGVVAVAHEAARAGALARSPADAIDRMQQRAALVARGVGLHPGAVELEWDVTRFGQQPGQVVVVVQYPVDVANLPLVGWMPSPIVRAEHVEWVDPWRSGVPGQ
jgi:hypothetical protein